MEKTEKEKEYKFTLLGEGFINFENINYAISVTENMTMISFENQMKSYVKTNKFTEILNKIEK